MYCSLIYSSDHVKKDEKGKACETYDKEDKCIENFGRKTWSKETKGKPKYRR